MKQNFKNIILTAFGVLGVFNMAFAQQDTDGDMRINVIFTEAQYDYSGSNEADDEEHTLELFARDRANLDGVDWIQAPTFPIQLTCDGECYHDIPDQTITFLYGSAAVPTNPGTTNVPLQFDIRSRYFEKDCWSCAGGFICLGSCGSSPSFSQYYSNCPCGCDCSDDDFLFDNTFNSAISVRSYAPGANADAGWFDGDGNPGASDQTRVRAAVNWTPPRPDFLTPTQTLVCPGTMITLNSAGAEWNGDYRWEFRNASVANVWTAFGSTGASQTFVVNEQTDFRVFTENGGTYSRSYRMETVNVKTLSTAPTTATASVNNVCPGTALTLNASGGTAGTGANFYWYSGSCGGLFLGTGASLSVTPTLTTTYFVRREGDCNTTNCASVVLNVRPQPATPFTSPVTVCASDVIILSATGSGSGSLSFYSNLANPVLGTYPMTATTPTQTHNAGNLGAGTYTFYVRETDGTCQSAAAPIPVVVNPSPPSPTVNPASPVCAGQSTTITASAASGTIVWYQDPAGIIPVGSGTSFTTPVLNGNTTYYLASVLGNCRSNIISVSVGVSTPSAPAAANTSVCSGGSATLNATGTGTLTWYADAGGLNSLGANPFTTPPLTQSTTYYVRDLVGVCPSALTPVTVSITPRPNSPAASAPSICEGQAAIITGSGSGTGDLNFYDASNTLVGTYIMSVGNNTGTYTTPIFAAAGTYSFFVTEEDGTCESFPTQVVVAVNPTPLIPVVTGNTVICEGSQATLSATGQVLWYDDMALTTLLSSNNVFTTPNLTTSRDYYVVASQNGCPSAVVTMAITVQPLPANTAVTGNMPICEGQSLSLTATGDAGSIFHWFLDANMLTLVQSGNAYATPALFGPTTYFVRETSSGGCVNLLPVQIMVNALPTPPAGGTFDACDGEAATLTAVGLAPQSVSVNWYDGVGTLLQSNPIPPSLVTYSPGAQAAGTYVYYVTQVGTNGCESVQSPVILNVHPTPAAPISSNRTACAGEETILTAIGSGTIQWFDSSSGGNMLATANTYTTPALNNSTTYYVSNTLNGCTSARVAVTVSIYQLPTLGAGNITANDPICEGQTLQLNAPTIPGVSYAWIGPNNWTSNLQNPSIANATEDSHQGFYELYLTDLSNSCRSEAYVLLVNIDAVPNASAASNAGPYCEGTDIQLYGSAVFQGNYAWSGPGGFASSLQNPTIPNSTIANAGQYELTVTVGNCSSSPSYTRVQVVPNALVDAGQSVTVLQGEVVQLNATGAVAYTWSPSTNLSNASLPNPSFVSMNTGVYVLTVTGYNGFGCSAQDTVSVTVLPQNTIRVVDLFTPNGDGVNEFWKIDYLQNVGNYTIKVFSRAGIEVLTTSNYNNDWDGTYEGKALPDGTYWYIIRTDNGEFKGAVTIKR